MHGPCGIEGCDCGHTIERLTKQRDKLLRACKATVRALDYGNIKHPNDPNYVNAGQVLADRQIAENLVRAAIANCKGE